MKHVKLFEQFLEESKVNEGIGTIALGVAGGLLLLKVLKLVLKKAFSSIGMHVKLPKEQLLKIVDETIKDALIKASGSGVNPMEIVVLQSYIKDEINSGRINTIKQIMQEIDLLSK
jgi:hypothetical protein